MKISILERLLVSERFRPMVSTKTGAILPPIVTKRPTTKDEAPHVVSRAKAGFTLTRPDSTGEVMQGFSMCPLESEDLVVRSLYDTLWEMGKLYGWNNRYASLEAALTRADSAAFPPKAAVVPFSTLQEIVGNELSEEDAERITLAKGCVTEVSGVKILSARGALSPGTAIIATTPQLVGTYMRASEHLSIMITRADRSLALVGDAVD